jgi:uncharacterized surface protein with fasciclin (FAS1) repeats
MSATPRTSARLLRSGAVLLAATLVAVGCTADDEDATPTTTAAPEATTPESTEAPTTTIDMTPPVNNPTDIVGTALEAGVFTDLAGYIIDAGLLDALRGGPFTVFAPTNDAFLKIPLETRRAVGGDIDTLTQILLYHVVEGTYLAEDLKDGELQTLAGVPLTISHDGDTVLVNDFPVAAADVVATNGVIHVMGDVLLPPS